MRFDSYGQGPRVVLVPGTKTAWGTLGERLSAHHKVFMVHTEELPLAAGDLERDAVALSEVGGRATYFGDRRAAPLCLQVALNYPTLVTRVILSGVAPGFPPSHLASRLGEVTPPVLLVVGELDYQVSRSALRVAEEIGDNAQVTVIPATGPNPQTERPGAFLNVVLRFMGDGA